MRRTLAFMMAQGILWTSHPHLSWKDFQGKAPRGAGEPSALSDTGFRTQLVCRGDVMVLTGEAEFYPRTSWVKQDRKFERLLVHEQGHFDITEIYLRRMKKAVREARLACDEGPGRRLLLRIDAEWEKAEREYDAETRNGIDTVRQQEWSARIARELEELNGY